jgi:hypothetical protein
MPLRENELARRGVGGIELRAEPLRVKWEFHDLVTADGHELRCAFTGSIRALPDRTERRMLEELLLDGRSALFGEDVARHFFDALRGAAARVAQSHEVKAWIETDAPRKELIDAIKAAAVPVAFACGLEILPPFQTDFQSSSFERQRVRAMQQALVEKEAAGQVEHLQRTAELLKQFQKLRSETPELSAGQALQQNNTADQGSVMQALLMAGARQQTAASLWAVAGPYLVRIEADKPIDGRTPPKPQLFPLPPTLGPLRSVQIEEIEGRPTLLIGAQHGFFLVRQDALAEAKAYHDSGFESPLGFNRVVYWPRHGQLCATHSEAGLVSWDLNAPAAPMKVMRPAAMGILPPTMPDLIVQGSASLSIRGAGGPMGPRNLRRIDAHSLIFTAGGRVISWDGNSVKTLAEPCSSEVIALLPEDRKLLSVHEDGTYCEIDYATAQVLLMDRRFGRVRAGAALPWMGGSRLLVAGDDGPVQCIGSADSLVTQYCSNHRGLRVLAGSSGMVAAVSPDRQRLVLWNSWEGRQPAAELFLAALARHRIADIVFG